MEVEALTSREHIIDEIKRIAQQCGRPPGRAMFERETGIRVAEWYGLCWTRWGDTLTEAGYEPNEKQSRLSSDDVLRHYALAVRHFGHVPANIELRMYTRERAGVPGHSTFTNHFGSKSALLAALSDWVRARPEFADLVRLIPEADGPATEAEATPAPAEGYVYLLKSGSHYKIGRSDEIERRIKQITVSLPEAATLVHTIRTDDPPGIEAYWHRRFAGWRAGGEWFRLSATDVRAFKRRKFQ